MSFLAPLTLLLGLVVLPLIVAMYLLRLRRTPLQVSSTYLWQRMVRDVEANAPWQRLRPNLLLFLQLLFAAALILALARPFSWSETGGSTATILVIDTSASMGAVDVTTTRLDAARSEARRIVDELPDEARVTVIAAGEKPTVLAASTTDRRQAHLAIGRVEAGSGVSDLGLALELASAIAARQPDAEIVVLSDGGGALPENLSVKGRLRYFPIGLSEENQAVSLFTLEKGLGGDLNAFVQVTNYGGDPASRRLGLFADGRLVNAYDLDLQAGGQQAVLVEGLPAQSERIEARLLELETGQDMLPTDDTAVLPTRSGDPLNVSLVSGGSRFLETALSLLPDADVTVYTPDEVEAGALPDADITILDSYIPLTATLPTGSLLFIGPPRSTTFFSVTGVVEAPNLRAVSPDDPILEHISLAEVGVLDSAIIPLPDWARPVIMGDVSGGSAPLLFAGQAQGRRVAVLSFDLRRSDLPLQVAFPLLLANLMDYLAPGGAGRLPDQVLPGEAVSFNLPAGVESVRIETPGGLREVTPQGGRVVFTETDTLGMYRLSWREPPTEPDGNSIERNAAFAVNAFLPEESRIAARESLPGVSSAGAGAAGDEGRGRREWWRPLALAALLLLTAEWLVYQRAAIARLRDTALRYLPALPGTASQRR